MSTDVRMYEIHAYDGIVVLRRVGINQHSKDDGLGEGPVPGTLPVRPDPPRDVVAILNLDSNTTQNHLPQTLPFPDGTSKNNLRGWGTVLRVISVWLYSRDHIMDVSDSPLLYTRDVSHNTEKLRDGLYVKLNFNAQNILSKTQEFLKDVYPSPQDFKITLKPKPPGK